MEDRRKMLKDIKFIREAIENAVEEEKHEKKNLLN